MLIGRINMNIKHFVILFIMSSIVLCSCVNNAPEQGSRYDVGDYIPAFQVTTSTGEVVSDKTLLGGKAMIMFFHTSCSDCQNALPIVQKFYLKHDDYKVICISRGQHAQSVAEYWNQHELTLPYSAQEDKAVYNIFAVSVIPQIYIIDEKGVIVEHFDETDFKKINNLIEDF